MPPRTDEPNRDLDRVIVDVLALMVEPTPRSMVARAISSASLCRSVRLPELHARLQALAEAGALVSAGDSWTVTPELRHSVTLELARRGELERVATGVRTARPAKISYTSPHGGWWDILRELRFSLYAGRWEQLREGLPKLADPWPALAEGVDPDWLDQLPADLLADAAAKIVEDATSHLRPCPLWMARLEAIPPATLDDNQHHTLVGRLILEGRLDHASWLATSRRSVQSSVDLAWLQLLRGDAAGAAEEWELALKAFLKESGRRARFFPDRAGLFFIVALLATGRLERAQALAAVGEARGVSAVPNGHAVLSWLARSLHSPNVDGWLCPSPSAGWDAVEVLIHALAQQWMGRPVPDLTRPIAEAEAAGLGWLAAQLARCAGARKKPVGIDLSTLLRRPDRVSQALAALEALVETKGEGEAAVKAPAEPDVRLVWVITHTAHWTMLEPREQVRSKGRWSKGRPVALKRLAAEASQLPHLSAADRVACALIREEVSGGRYRQVSYHLDAERALLVLGGEAHLVVEQGAELVPAQVKPATPRLSARREGDRIELSLRPSPVAKEDARLVPAGPTSFELFRFDPLHHDIARILGRTPLQVPQSEEPRVKALLRALGGRVQTEAELP